MPRVKKQEEVTTWSFWEENLITNPVPESPAIETIINTETGKEEIIITEENAAEVAKMIEEEFAADPIPFEAPTELTLWWKPYVFDADEFQSFIKNELMIIMERSQMPKEFYNAKFKLKHELQKLIDTL